MMRILRWSLVPCLLAATGNALAADQCPLLRSQQSDPEVATRIAAVACDEHIRWRRPFITTDGRLAGAVVWEGEGNGLQDGGSPWRQVAAYWQTSGLLSQMAYKPGAGDCSYATANPGYPGLGCRGFVIDNPWSAAFVSWVMQRAGVPGFVSSGGHYDYVRAARSNPGGSPYRFLEPTSTAAGVGDLLCYVRGSRVYGHQGLAAAIDGGTTGLAMHCDIVVATNPGGDGKAYLIGGNVLQAVTMRVLNVNATGNFWGLPRRSEGDVACSPDAQSACDSNRQDWAVLLKLKPQEELARIGPVAPPSFLPRMPQGQQGPTCCVNCVVGSGVPRCPAQGEAKPQQPWGLPQDSE